MATILMNTSEGPLGIDNSQSRLVSYGTISFQPDLNPDGSLGTTFTYTAGGIRCLWKPLEYIKAATLLPEWVDLEPWITWQYSYIWSPGHAVYNIAIASGVLTASCNNSFQVGDTVRLQNLTNTATYPSATNVTDRPGSLGFLNGMRLNVASATATSFTANVNFATLASTPCTGLAVGVGHAPLPFPPVQIPAGGMMSGWQWMGVVRLFYTAVTYGQVPGDVGLPTQELLAGPIPNVALQDVVAFRGEFMRSYN